jgi:hypothetical protein
LATKTGDYPAIGECWVDLSRTKSKQQEGNTGSPNTVSSIVGYREYITRYSELNGGVKNIVSGTVGYRKYSELSGGVNYYPTVSLTIFGD